MDSSQEQTQSQSQSQNKQQKTEKLGLYLSMYSGMLFVVIEFLMAVFTHSQAVLLDSVYDAAELILIVVSLQLLPLFYKPSSEKRPYGYGQVESMFIIIKGFTMSLVTLGLVLNNIQIILSGGRHVQFGAVGLFELFATLLSVGVIFLLLRFNKKVASPMLQTEINGWLIDAVSSFGMAIAFFLPYLITAEWFMGFTPYLDQIIAILLSLFILPVPVKSVISGLRDLFLLAPEEDTMDLIKRETNQILAPYQFTEITYDVVKTARKLWVSVYVTSPTDTISISQLANIQKQIEARLQQDFPGIYFELLPEID